MSNDKPWYKDFFDEYNEFLSQHKADQQHKGRFKLEWATIYRFYNSDGVLLYVGASANPNMLDISRRSREWWKEVATATLQHNFESREELYKAHMDAIRNEHPLYNTRDENRFLPVNLDQTPEN